MTTIDDSGMRAEIKQNPLREGNGIKTAAEATSSASVPLYSDANSQVKAAGFPFAVQLYAGVTDTSFSSVDIKGSSTDTSPQSMYQTLVRTAMATFTTSGWMRVNVTDLAGNIVNGNYYIPFGLLG